MTGAAGGIGRAIVDTLLADGVIVIAVDRDAAGLTALVAEQEATRPGAALHVRPVDLTDTAEVDALVDWVEAEIGPISGLVNGAGVIRSGSAMSQTDDDWATVHATNVGGVMRMSRAVTRRMAVRQRGAVVTIGSNAAAVARDGLSAYAASKAAAKQYTLSLGIEVAPLGIRCNVVSPGSTDTPMLRGAWEEPTPRPLTPVPVEDDGTVAAPPAPETATAALERRVIAGTPEAFWPGVPLGRIAQPQDIAEAVCFLLSDRARHIALHDLRVDGGATLGA
ncbi:MAG: SDR family NAD(P)-dependent oxidoreductase [Solirubrobacteraceae bacterium]|nr:SDR family oxidoreductase [Patulibacter sp.]